MNKNDENTHLLAWLFLLLFGYGLIWTITFVKIQYMQEGFIFAALLSLICWYPATATAYLFTKKFDAVGWKICLSLAILAIVLLCAVFYYSLVLDKSAGAGYGVVILGIPNVVLGYISTVGMILAAAFMIKSFKTLVLFGLCSIGLPILTFSSLAGLVSGSGTEIFWAIGWAGQVICYAITMAAILRAEVEPKSVEQVC